jgi:filamentous hemagglutinin
MTNSIERRAGEQLNEKGITIAELKGLGRLSQADTRSVEQALIEYHGLGKNSGTLINKINSIAKSNPVYSESLKRGAQLLHDAGYPGF